MFITKVEPRLAVPVTEGTVVTVHSVAGQDVDVVVDNLSTTNTLVYKWQSSPDGLAWADVAAFANVAPNTRAIATLNVALATHYRLRASGNLDVAVKADAQLSGSTTATFACDGRFQTKVVPEITVADTSDTFVTVFTFQGIASQSRRVIVENTGALQLDGFKFQSSPDNVNWTDVAASVTLAAGDSNKTTLSGEIYYRIQVDTDGTTLAVKIDAEVFNLNKILTMNVV